MNITESFIVLHLTSIISASFLSKRVGEEDAGAGGSDSPAALKVDVKEAFTDLREVCPSSCIAEI